MESQEVKPTAKVGAIIGVVLIIIGIVIIGYIAFMTIAVLSHEDRDQIWNVISSPSFWRMFGITFGIPIVVAIVVFILGYCLIKSAK